MQIPERHAFVRRTPIVLLVFGEGGHATAMCRLYSGLDFSGITVVQFTELDALKIGGIPQIEAIRIMPKRSEKWRLVRVPIALLDNLIRSAYIFLRYDVKIVVTTGPGIAIIPAAICRMLGKPTIFLESWCRFEKFSTTANILKYLSARIYAQNFELIALDDQAIFGGRL